MKKVFSNNEVPHIWAQQTQNEGRGSNIFFEGATIYSYGKHFPMATIEGDTVLFTLHRYSNTTAKHLSKTWSAVSHKTIIDCYEVPVKYDVTKPIKKCALISTHQKNIQAWKKEIQSLFDELGNKKIRNIEGRVSGINTHIKRLTAYTQYFGIKIKDAELKKLLKIAASDTFLSQAKEAKEKADKAAEKKMKEAAKAFDTYLTLWRKNDTDAITNLPQKTKDLCNYYNRSQTAFTRLRFNSDQNRVETSKGVQIPAEIAKRAYIQLNGCMEGSCKDISVPVMNYTITETGKDYIKAGCHTIPKEDVRYIAELLNW